MTIEEIRESVGLEMDYWRAWMLDRVNRTELTPEEVIVCAILANASSRWSG
jgi:hypothetical protein